VVSLKVVNPLTIYQNAKFHGPTLTGTSFISTPKVLTSAILMVTAKALKLWRLGHLQWHALSTEFHKNYQLVQKLMGGGAQTGW
jgi:hypothetical protein